MNPERKQFSLEHQLAEHGSPDDRWIYAELIKSGYEIVKSSVPKALGDPVAFAAVGIIEDVEAGLNFIDENIEDDPGLVAEALGVPWPLITACSRAVKAGHSIPDLVKALTFDRN